MQQMAVEHVVRHGCTRGERGDSADQARLRGVGLDDVRAERADLGDHLRERLSVGEGVRRAPEPVDADVGERTGSQLELVGFVVRDSTGEQALLEPLGIEVFHQVGDDASWSAHVHPRDDAQHADAVRHEAAR